MPRPLKVFLVEDSPEIRESLQQTLESDGGMSVVGYADNSPRAIDALQTLEIDAVIVDINLREGSGFQVLTHLNRSGNPKSILRIVLTNQASPLFKRTCAELGAEYFFDKSLEFDQAIEVLKIRSAK